MGFDEIAEARRMDKLPEHIQACNLKGMPVLRITDNRMFDTSKYIVLKKIKK